jgi:hypothetical protein
MATVMAETKETPAAPHPENARFINFTQTDHLPYIYGIRPRVGKKIYIGSSRAPMDEHLYQYGNTYRHGNSRKGVKRVLDEGDVCIFRIETFPCKSNSELTKREQHWMSVYRKNPAFNVVNVRNAHNPNEKERTYGTKRSEPRNCECGGRVSEQNRHIHRATMKHRLYVLTQGVEKESDGAASD